MVIGVELKITIKNDSLNYIAKKKKIFRSLHFGVNFLFLFFREFQPMVSAPNNNSLSSNQDTSRFLVEAGIEPQISYSTIRDFTS